MKLDFFKDYKDLTASLSYFLILLFVSLAYLPLFQNIGFLGIQDFDYNFFTQSVSIDAIKNFGEVPLMNFFDQGGVPLLATPFSHSLSPFNLLYFIFDNLLALKIEIFLHALLGTLGMFFLLKDYKFRNDTSLCISLVFGLNSYHALNIAQGQYEFLSAFLIPLVLLSMRKKHHLGFILLVSIMFLSGGVYLLAMLGIILLLLCIRNLNNLKFVVVGGVGAALLSSIKLIPTLSYMSKHPRIINDFSGFSLSSLLHSLVNSEQLVFKTHDFTIFKEFMKKLVYITDSPSFLTGMDYGWDENGMYIGWFFLGCFIASVFYHLAKKAYLKEIVLSLIVLLISFGDRITPSLWGFLKLFPPFESMRHSTRFRIFFLIFICILIAALINKLMESRKSIVKLSLMAFSLIITLSTVGKLNYKIISESFVISPLEKEVREDFHYINEWKVNKSYAESHEQGFFPAYLSNRGVSYNKENHSVAVVVLEKSDPNYKGEVHSEGEEVKITSRTSSKLIFEASKAGKYIVNHNFLDGWRCQPECEIENENGLLGVIVKKKGSVLLSYDPISFKIGMLISFLTIFSIVILKNSTTNKPFKKLIEVFS